MSPNHLPTVIVLACGAGRRFRSSLKDAAIAQTDDNGFGYKLHARLGHQRVLDWTVAAAQSSGLPVYVHQGEYFEGMGDSIAAAVSRTSGAQGWLVLPGDLPFIASQTITQVAAALQHHPVVVPFWQGQRAHPVGFALACRDALLSVSGEAGASSVVQTMGAQRLDVQDAGVAQDVDTWGDLQVLREQLGRGAVVTRNIGLK